jgi:hypothetical protein
MLKGHSLGDLQSSAAQPSLEPACRDDVGRCCCPPEADSPRQFIPTSVKNMAFKNDLNTSKLKNVTRTLHSRVIQTSDNKEI